MAAHDLAGTAKTLLDVWDNGTQMAPITDDTALSVVDAYDIAGDISAMRVARGEQIVGRKIGFTNRSIWELYGVDAPMWAPMYDTTVAELPVGGEVELPNLAEPRIEPEIAFHFAKSPSFGMELQEIAGCIDWMAHGIEIVTSPFPGWHFKLPDCTAAQSLHGRFWYGPKRAMPDDIGVLENFELKMTGPRGTLQGHARDVLDGPLHAVRFLLGEIEKSPNPMRIQPGEIVTTGTLTDAGPVAAGEVWETALSGIDLPGIAVSFA